MTISQSARDAAAVALREIDAEIAKRPDHRATLDELMTNPMATLLRANAAIAAGKPEAAA